MGARRIDTDADDALLARARSDPDGRKGREALEALFARYDERVYAWCRRYTRDHERALDWAQDVMLLAFRAIGGFEGRARFSSWLFSIARRHCWRQAGKVAAFQDDEVDPDTLEAGTSDPAAQLETREAQADLLESIERVLEPAERRALWLRCYEELSVEEITRDLGLTSTSGARAVLQTARRKLRAELRRRGEG